MEQREQDLITHYNQNTDYYSPVMRANVEELFTEMEVPPITKLDFVLDVGCGDGRLGRWLYELYRCHYYGADYSRERIAKAILHLPDTPEFRANNNIYYSVQDINTWTPPMAHKAFMFEVLEHLENPREVLERIASFTYEGVFGSVPINMPYKAHLQVYKTPEEVEKKLGVEVMSVKKYAKRHAFFRYTDA